MTATKTQMKQRIPGESTVNSGGGGRSFDAVQDVFCVRLARVSLHTWGNRAHVLKRNHAQFFFGGRFSFFLLLLFHVLAAFALLTFTSIDHHHHLQQQKTTAVLSLE